MSEPNRPARAPWIVEKRGNERTEAQLTLEKAKEIEKAKIQAGTHKFKSIIDAAGRVARILILCQK